MDIRSFIQGFRKIAGPNLPTSVEKMLAHQEKPAQDHPVFGRIAPHGIDGWRTQFSTQFMCDGEFKLLSVDCFVQEPNSRVSQENFAALSHALESIARQFVIFDLAEFLEPQVDPDEWDGFLLDLEIADTPYSNNLRWRATGHNGRACGEYQMFFEGLELKGIVQFWDDPVSKGFEDW